MKIPDNAEQFTENIVDCDEHGVSSSKKSNADNDVVSKLERLAALKEKGILNDEEFQIQKNKILKLEIRAAQSGRKVLISRGK